MAVLSVVCFCAVFNKTEDNGEIIFGFLVLLGFNVLFAIAASTLVAFEVRNACFMKLDLLTFQLDAGQARLVIKAMNKGTQKAMHRVCDFVGLY